jgi:Tfp pilus assembly protein PilV
MLVALVILSVSILGMTSLTLTTMRANFDNDLRNAVVRVTSEVAEDLGATPIESVVSTPTGTPEIRQASIRGTNIPFEVTRTVIPLTNDLRQVNITVSYTSNGITKTNSAVVYKHRAS